MSTKTHIRRRDSGTVLAFWTLLWLGCSSGCKALESRGLATVSLELAVKTEPVSDDPDDPAIWIHPNDSSLSLILGTNKVALPNGALYVFDLDGKILQKINQLDRPNNVDVEQGVKLGEQTVDIAVVTERRAGKLRIYAVNSKERRLKEIAQLK